MNNDFLEVLIESYNNKNEELKTKDDENILVSLLRIKQLLIDGKPTNVQLSMLRGKLNEELHKKLVDCIKYYASNPYPQADVQDSLEPTKSIIMEQLPETKQSSISQEDNNILAEQYNQFSRMIKQIESKLDTSLENNQADINTLIKVQNLMTELNSGLISGSRSIDTNSHAVITELKTAHKNLVDLPIQVREQLDARLNDLELMLDSSKIKKYSDEFKESIETDLNSIKLKLRKGTENIVEQIVEHTSEHYKEISKETANKTKSFVSGTVFYGVLAGFALNLLCSFFVARYMSNTVIEHNDTVLQAVRTLKK